MADMEPPQARRLQPPSWRDARLIVGLVLVLLSVAGGARLFAAMDSTTPVWAASRPLLPGQEVREQDLTPVAVHLDGQLPQYLDATASIGPGTYVLRQVQPGELVPATALGSAQQARDKTVTVPVDPASARTISVGTVVDVWVSRRDRGSSGVAYLDPELLLEQAVVAQVPGESGALGIGVGRAAVQIVVPADRVGAVISSVDQEAKVTLVPSPHVGDAAP